MRHRLWIVTVVCLTACAPRVDDPGNIPRRGHWTLDGKVARVSINDLTFDRAKAPFDLPKDKHEDLGCMEPVLKSLADANEAIAERTHNQCQVDTLDQNGSSITGNGRCTFNSAAMRKAGGLLTLAGEERADAVSLHHTMNLFIHSDTGSTDKATIVMETDWTRVGDC